MKKTISINLQGIIFHVEEDGYALLNSYLASVKAYFSSFEGHEEIMADIESRMAELFLTRLNPGKQIISLEDVQHLITRMGSVQDFAAQNEEQETENNYSQQSTYTNATPGAEPGTRKLYRDESRRMVAGVAAGIANYLSVDPLWVRLFFVLTVIGLPFTGGGSAVGFVLYAVLWAVLPVSHSLPDRKVKKLYRDPEDKKLGGVSAGIGAYFGIDAIWIRLFFLVSVFFFGTGVLAYIVLWIVMPEAKTPSEKAEMRGNPVTLSSIEAAVRNNQAFKDERGQENMLARIVLLPVQLLSQLIEVLGPTLKVIFLFLLTLIRILAGILLIMLGVAFMTGAIVLLLSGFSVISDEYRVIMADIPVMLFRDDLSWYGTLAAFFVVLIPGIVVITTGLGLLAKRWLMRAPVGWTLFSLWLVSVVVLTISGALFASNFKRTAMFTEQERYQLPASEVLLLSTLSGDSPEGEVSFEKLDLTIESGTDSASIVVLKQYEGKGRTEEDASRSARMVYVPVTATDSALLFGTKQLFKPGTRFRDQELSLRLLLPEGKPFKLDPSLAGYVSFSPSPENFFASELAGQTMLFRNGTLRCLSCTAQDSLQENRPAAALDIPRGATSKTYNLEDFNGVNMVGLMKVNITRGNSYKVRVYGSKAQIDDLEVSVDREDQLKIQLDESMWKNRKDKQLVVEIQMPELETVMFAGAVEGTINGFTTENMEVALVGASSADLNVRNSRLNLSLIGASSLTAAGTTEFLSAELVGASELKASDLKAKRAKVEAVGASSARILVMERLEAEASGASSIRYAGNPRQVEQDESGAGSIKAD